MRSILVFQHVAHHPLGTLNPLLKKRGFRIRYVNFGRDPAATVDLEGYNGLILLGGPMGVYETLKYPHLKEEMRVIELALKKEIPVLGICLGAQLVAQVLGSHVRKHTDSEIGWFDLDLTDAGKSDPLFGGFRSKEKIFEVHGDTFDIPKDAIHLAQTAICHSQAFRFGGRVYGLQFHLEVDAAMIHRWLSQAENLEILSESKGRFQADVIERETKAYIKNSNHLSELAFSKFIDLFGLKERKVALGSGHGKPHR